MVTLSEVKDYLGIDYSDRMVDANINALIQTAGAYLVGSIGQDYPEDDPRAKTLSLIIIADLYDNRGTSGNDKVNAHVVKMVNDFALQLKLEMRGAANEI